MKFNVPAAFGCLALVIALTTAVSHGDSLQAEKPVIVPAAAYEAPAASGQQTAILAGGCFWGVQGVFSHVKGVKSAVSGYAGGQAGTAQYETVSTGSTGHAEAVKIVFDPAQVSYATLLRIFFSVVADPTTLNFQGPDHGTQYRTAIFPTTPDQKMTAQRYIAQLKTARVWPRPIVTRVETGRFFPAESYHQDFLARMPNHPYILTFDAPKVTALKQLYPALYRAQPVLVRAG